MHRLSALLIGVALVAVAAVPASASDSSEAKKLVVLKSDVDSEYTSSKDTSNTDSFADVAECVGKPVKGRKVSARIVGPELVQAEQDRIITSSFTVLKTEKMAKADRAVLQSSKTPDCVAQLAEDQGAEDVQVQRGTVDKLGDYSTAVLASYTTQGGEFMTVEVAIITGRGELDVSFTAAGDTPFPREEAEEILADVQERIDDADL